MKLDKHSNIINAKGKIVGRLEYENDQFIAHWTDENGEQRHFGAFMLEDVAKEVGFTL